MPRLSRIGDMLISPLASVITAGVVIAVCITVTTALGQSWILGSLLSMVLNLILARERGKAFARIEPDNEREAETPEHH
jgi:hypothetical protein